MVEEIYRKLQEHLHQHPMGYPATKSGVELELLKKMFEQEEAEIAVTLTPKPETPEVIASRLGYDAKVMAEKLNRMARRGLIMHKGKGGNITYNLEPYVVGMYEFQLKRMDEEFIQLSQKFAMEGLGGEIFGSKTPYFKVLPVEKSIPINDLLVLPHEKVSEVIEKSKKIAITDCICRTKEKMLHSGCERTIQSCMVFDDHAEYYMEIGMPGRFVNKQEALDILEQTEKEGLVHTTQNTGSGVFAICNCCSCCCGILKAIKDYKLHSRVARSSYFAKVDEDLCVGCESCLDSCQFKAISIEDGLARIKLDFCMGCGICTSSCATGALSLIRKPEEQIVMPPANLEAMFNQIGKEKGRTMKVVLE